MATDQGKQATAKMLAEIWSLDELLCDDAEPSAIVDQMRRVDSVATAIGGKGSGAAQAVYEGWQQFRAFAASMGMTPNELTEPFVAMIASEHYDGGEADPDAQDARGSPADGEWAGGRHGGGAVHRMHLLEQPWRQIAAGEKRCELRVLDAKRRKVAVGDTVDLSILGGGGDALRATVVAIRRAESFRDLLGDEGVLEASGFDSMEGALAALREIYGADDREVVGIFIDANGGD